jgi:hypothetical protein
MPLTFATQSGIEALLSRCEEIRLPNSIPGTKTDIVFTVKSELAFISACPIEVHGV